MGSRDHALLPWYFNGTLDEQEAASFCAHLAGCDACRDELATLEQLREQLEAHGETFLQPHPAPAVLVAGVRDELEGDAAQEVQRHLAICAACSIEASWVRGDAVAEGGSVAVAPARGMRPAWGWLAAAAMLVFSIVAWNRGGVAVPGPLQHQLVGPVERGGAGSTVTLSPDAPMLYLFFEIDLPREAFPVSLELRDAGDARVRLDESLAFEALTGGLYLSYACPTAVCVPGGYTAVVSSEQTDALLELPFTIVAAP